MVETTQFITAQPSEINLDGIHVSADPDHRIQQLTSTNHWSKPLYGNLLNLNRAVASEPHIEREVGRVGATVLKSHGSEGMYTTLGLDYHKDFYEYLYSYAVSLSTEVAHSTLSTSEKLKRLGCMAGTLVAESQFFTIGNKRTARALYGLIIIGKDGAVPAYNAAFSFEPPQELENLILIQNMARLHHTSNIFSNMSALGGVFVEPEVVDSMSMPAFNLAAIRYGIGASRKYLTAQQWYTYNLEERATINIKDKKLRNQLVATLAQEKYGPAACSFVCPTVDELDSLNEPEARKLVAIGNQLLRMRIISLLSGLASGGIFVNIEDAPEADDNIRSLQKIYWQPDIPESLSQ